MSPVYDTLLLCRFVYVLATTECNYGTHIVGGELLFSAGFWAQIARTTAGTTRLESSSEYLAASQVASVYV